MKRYCIKSQPGKTGYLDILAETDEGYKVRITRLVDGDKKTQEDFLERSLFETCLTTGYIAELTDEELNCSAA
jgi:folate-dependent tRNA-U54 methylase TrmFO/GidA